MDILFEFNHEKNAWLIEHRGISFEEIIAALQNRGALDVVEHPNTKKYPNQKLYVVEIHGYIYLVPFVENKNNIFLKTIFPSRKATKTYLPKEEDEHD